MSILNDIFKGAVALSIFAIFQYGFTVKDMSTKAAKAHQKGLTKYGHYSRVLTDGK